MSDNAFVLAVKSALVRLGTKRGSPLRSLVTWAGQLLSVRSSGALDIATDDETIAGPGGLGGRSAVVGIPGCKVAPQPGARLRVAFRDGSPEGLEVVAFEQEAAADRGVTRRGDRVKVATVSYTVGVTPDIDPKPLINMSIQLHASPYDDAGDPPPIVISFYGVVLSGWPPVLPLPVYAWVDTGSPEVMLRHLDSEVIP